MKQEINPKDTSGAKAFELWMKAITEIGHLGDGAEKVTHVLDLVHRINGRGLLFFWTWSNFNPWTRSSTSAI